MYCFVHHAEPVPYGTFPSLSRNVGRGLPPYGQATQDDIEAFTEAVRGKARSSCQHCRRCRRRRCCSMPACLLGLDTRTS